MNRIVNSVTWSAQAEAQVLTFVRDSRGEVRTQAYQLYDTIGSGHMSALLVSPSPRLLEICLPGHAGSGWTTSFAHLQQHWTGLHKEYSKYGTAAAGFPCLGKCQLPCLPASFGLQQIVSSMQLGWRMASGMQLCVHMAPGGGLRS